MNIESQEITEPAEQIETPQIEEATESVADSIRAAMEDLGSNEEADESLQGDEDEAAPTAEETADAARTLAKSKKAKRTTYEAKDLDLGSKGKKGEAEQVERIEPPHRFPVEKKEWFNRQPREVQEEVSKAFREQEAYFTKTSQDLQRERVRYAEVNQVVDSYLPKWGIAGLTPQAAVAELCATQDWIMKDPVAAYSHMLAKTGLTPEDLIEARDGQGYALQQQQRYAQPAPEILDLTNKVNTLYSQLEQSQLSQQQQMLNAAVGEIDAVRREISSDGTYLYPELHDPAQLQRVQPFVEDLRKNQPSINWGEATKRAIHTLRVLDGKVGVPSPQSQKLPTNDLNRIKSAAVSVSGRGNGSAPISGLAKDGESVADSVRAVLAGMQQRN